ncbi:ATP-binding cassette domain-containing protein [Myceligenerans halotolerans]
MPRYSKRARPGGRPGGSWRGYLMRALAPVVPLTMALAGIDAWLAVVTGDLVAIPSLERFWMFAGLTATTIVGGVIVTGWWRVVAARGESRLRGELLAVTLRRTLPDLEEQAIGSLLERTDDDPRALFSAFRRLGEVAFYGLVGAVVAWVAAGVAWWPAWWLFPVVGALALLTVRGTGARITAATTAAEEAWSDSAAQLEEAVAARDDMRAVGGQPFVLRRFARAGAAAIRAQLAASILSARFSLRLSLVMAGLTAVVVLGGVAAVRDGGLEVARFVTLFLLVAMFVRRLHTLTSLLPQIQEGLGTLARVRGMLDAAQEPALGGRLGEAGGAPGARIDVRDLTFTYPAADGDGFRLGPVSLSLPAGRTVALVGRTGSGKTTLTKVLSRAVEPPAGSVLLDGVDVRDLDVEHLRGTVGVVGQRTEILSGTLRQNIALFGDVPAERVGAAIAALGLTGWVDGLPDGLDTVLGPRGVMLSAGEEQLVAFARLLVRDVRVVVLDEATARMDPYTSRTVTHAARGLLAGRTGIVVAHRLATARVADTIAVMDHGRIVEHGTWDELAAGDGRFAALVEADGTAATRDDDAAPAAHAHGAVRTRAHDTTRPRAGSARVPVGRTATRAALTRPRWWIPAELLMWLDDVVGSGSAVAGWVWAALVTALMAGANPWWPAAGVIAAALFSSVVYYLETRPRTMLWTEGRLRVRLAILRGQTGHAPVERPSPGEVTARTLEEYRLLVLSRTAREFAFGLTTLAVLGGVSGSPIAVAIAAGVVGVSAGAAGLGARLVGDTARLAGDARAAFGRALGSVLEAVRTIKLSGATGAALAHLRRQDAERVAAAQREDRVSYLVWQAPWLVSRSATVLVWWLHVAGTWSLTTTLVVYTAIGAYGWVGATAGNVVTRIPVARRWTDVATRLAGTSDLAAVPADVDLVRGTHRTSAATVPVGPLARLRLAGVSAVHDDGTIGVRDVHLEIRPGQTVLVVGRVGAGKSSLLAGLAGLVRLDGAVTWNETRLTGMARLAGTRTAFVGQVPRIVSGTVAENVHLDHDRAVASSLVTAQLDEDVSEAGGHGTVVGHRGLRLSGGQVQRLALARALAADPDLLVVDDVSSALDAGTEAALWTALRASGRTIVGSSSRAATLDAADHVVVLDHGRQVDAGLWDALRTRWGHLAG